MGHNQYTYDSLYAIYLRDSLDSLYLPTFSLEELTGQIDFAEDTNFRPSKEIIVMEVERSICGKKHVIR